MERRNIFQTDYPLITLLLTKLLHSNIVKRIFKLIAFVFIGAASVSVASCGDKDEPEDPTTVVDPSDDPSDKDDNPSSEKIDISSLYGRTYETNKACNIYDGTKCNFLIFRISKDGKEATYWLNSSETATLGFSGKATFSGNRVTINSKGTSVWDGVSSSDDGPLTFGGYIDGKDYNYTVEIISADKSRIVTIDQDGFKNTLEFTGLSN